MPVHDAMYTVEKAEKLQKIVSPDTNQELYDWLDAVIDEAVEASSASARASLAFFEALNYAKSCSDPKIAALAQEIYSGNYNAEIA